MLTYMYNFLPISAIFLTIHSRKWPKIAKNGYFRPFLVSQFFLDHGILKKTLQCDSVTHSGHVSTIFGDSVSLPRKRDISDRLAFDRNWNIRDNLRH